MNDEEIVRLYYERSEDGIAQSEQKYGRLCRSVIRRILPDERDAEECLSDVWIRTWNSIPPEKPRVLGAFLARIARNLAVALLFSHCRRFAPFSRASRAIWRSTNSPTTARENAPAR